MAARPASAPEPLPDPSQLYATPEELAADEDLTLEERAALLERWAEDDEALMRAEDEGMAGGERPRLARVAALLALVRRDLERAKELGDVGETGRGISRPAPREPGG